MERFHLKKSKEVEGKEQLNISLEGTEVTILEAEEKSPSREKSTLGGKKVKSGSFANVPYFGEVTSSSV
jgi:hypothetical protein